MRSQLNYLDVVVVFAVNIVVVVVVLLLLLSLYCEVGVDPTLLVLCGSV